MSFEDEIKFTIKMLELTGNVNVLFSPVSILNGLSLIYFNTKDETEKGLAQIFGKDKEKAISYFAESINHCESKNKANIKFINNFFVSANTEISPKFAEIIEEKFNGNIYQSNFDDKNMLTNEKDFIVKSTIINIAEHIIDEKGFDPCKNSILINFLNFSSSWENNFDKAHMQIFYSDQPREIKFMSKTVTPDLKWNFVKSEKWTCLGIPYQDFEAWMYMVLPEKNYTLTELIKDMNTDSFKEWTKRNSILETDFDVTIPLFTVSSNLKFKEILKKMGLKNVFNEGTENISSSKFDNLIHTSFITIDEYGTEAQNNKTKLHRNLVYESENKFAADRPFLYFIMTNNKVTKASNLLYIGTFF